MLTPFLTSSLTLTLDSFLGGRPSGLLDERLIELLSQDVRQIVWHPLGHVPSPQGGFCDCLLHHIRDRPGVLQPPSAHVDSSKSMAYAKGA